MNTKSKSYCSVPQCNQYGGPGISFHGFPKDNTIRKKWILALKIGKSVSNYMKVCGGHFERDDYILPGISTKRPRLKKNAIPSKNLPVSSIVRKRQLTPEKKARESRLQKRQAAADLLNIRPAPSGYSEESERSAPRTLFDAADPDPDGEATRLEAAEALVQFTTALDRESLRETSDFGVQVTPSIIDTQKFTAADILKTDKQLRAFTGIPTLERFQTILEAVEKAEKLEGSRRYVISCRDRFMMCLIKLKLNLTYVCLSALFEVTATCCKRHFCVMIALLARIMSHVIRFPPMSEIRRNMPKCFEKYQNCRIVLDATEVKIEKSKCLKCRISTYSHYKGCHTFKVLIGTTPSGLISYVSKCYGGRTSDKAILLKSNLLELFQPKDAIMVDKGFLIESECRERGIDLIRPPFLRDRKQMSPKEAVETASIAAARVHVERAIQRMKIFKILKTDVSYDLLPYCDSIVTTICGLCNLSAPILSDDKFLQ